MAASATSGLASIFCKSPDLRAVGLCRTIQQYVNEWMSLCTSKTLFTKRGGGLDLAINCSVSTPESSWWGHFRHHSRWWKDACGDGEAGRTTKPKRLLFSWKLSSFVPWYCKTKTQSLTPAFYILGVDIQHSINNYIKRQEVNSAMEKIKNE